MIDPADFSKEDLQLINLLKSDRGCIVFSRADKFNQLVEFNIFNNEVELNAENQTVKYKNKEFKYLHLDLTQNDSLSSILELLANMICKLFGKTQAGARISRERHRQSILDTCKHLNRGHALFEQVNSFSLSELLAQDLRDAAHSIGQVTGKTDTEDVLDLVFSSFCIGK